MRGRGGGGLAGKCITLYPALGWEGGVTPWGTFPAVCHMLPSLAEAQRLDRSRRTAQRHDRSLQLPPSPSRSLLKCTPSLKRTARWHQVEKGQGVGHRLGKRRKAESRTFIPNCRPARHMTKWEESPSLGIRPPHHFMWNLGAIFFAQKMRSPWSKLSKYCILLF